MYSPSLAFNKVISDRKSTPHYFIFIDIIQHCMVIHSRKNNTMKKTYKYSIFLVYIQYNIYLFSVFTFKNASIACVCKCVCKTERSHGL